MAKKYFNVLFFLFMFKDVLILCHIHYTLYINE